MLETRRRSRQRSDRLRFHPRIRRHNDDGRIRKASGGRPKALYGMPEVQRDLILRRTPTSSRLQAFRTPSLKGLTSRGRFWRHPSGGKRFIVRAAEMLTAFVELRSGSEMIVWGDEAVSSIMTPAEDIIPAPT